METSSTLVQILARVVTHLVPPAPRLTAVRLVNKDLPKMQHQACVSVQQALFLTR